jgi:hypothetical protein
MDYASLSYKLRNNLNELKKQYEKWLATKEEVEKYKEYINKTLHAYTVIEWPQDYPKKKSKVISREKN